LKVTGPVGWTISPADIPTDGVSRDWPVELYAPVEFDLWPMKNIFEIELQADSPVKYEFGIAGAGLWKMLGFYYDALPDPDNPVQCRRAMNHHFVSLDKEYLPEPGVDVEKQYSEWSRTLGRPALIPSCEHEIDMSRLVGLRGPYCAYLARTVVSPVSRPGYFVVGNNDAYRIYLNGEKVAEVDEHVWWTPFNNVHKVELKEGENHILVKLLKRGDDLHFTMGIRNDEGPRRELGFHCQDWTIDLADKL
jgi:hypothetical protein